MTVRDIQGHLQDMYGVELSAALISEVTDMEEVKAWQDRSLDGDPEIRDSHHKHSVGAGDKVGVSLSVSRQIVVAPNG